VAIGECIYVFGGCGVEGRLSDLHEYNTKTQTWKQLSSEHEIQGRGGTPLSVSPDKANIFVLGGFAGKEMSDIHMYNLADDKWSQLKVTLPEPISVAIALPIEDKMLLFGGEVTPSAKGHAGAGKFSDLTTIFRGDMEAVVERKSQGPPARGWTAGTVWSDNQVIVVGGLTGDDENPIRIMDVWVGQLNN